MIRRLLALAFLVGLVACGGASKPAPAAAEPPLGNDAASAPETTTCEDACTSYAACYEEVNGADFHGGGECVSACEELADDARASYFTCVDSSDCAKVAAC